MSALDLELKQAVICNICREIMIDKIYQCKTGHLFCPTCIAKIDKCALCKETLYDRALRAIIIEQLRDHISLPCKNDGCDTVTHQHKKHKAECKFNKCFNTNCTTSGTEEEMKIHNNMCKFRKVKCLQDDECVKLFTYDELIDHLKMEHKTTIKPFTLGECKTLTIPKVDHSNLYQYSLPNNDIIVIKLTKRHNFINIDIKSFITEIYECRIRVFDEENSMTKWINNLEVKMKIPDSLWYECFNIIKLDRTFDILIKLTSNK